MDNVRLVRTFKSTGIELGVGQDGDAWYVFDRSYDREHPEQIGSIWHRHCGPYSNDAQAIEWIDEIRES